MDFIELKINKKLKDGLADMGFQEMMPIQEETIPLILDGENIIGEAETGTGKTAAFVIPLLNNIDFKSNQTECLIVTPTRELAIQIAVEVEKIGKFIRPSCAVLVGGESIRDQVSKLRNNPSIVVGTLGRINDHIRNKKLDLSHIRYFVLDEADEMLKEGFKEDITIINDLIPNEKQALLFSATISKQILSLSKNIMADHKFVSVKNKENPKSNIDQYYIIMKEKQKFSILTKFLDIDNPTSAIIFGRTKRRVDELNEALNKCGYKSVGLHGDLSQQQRNAVMKRFRENKISILVATDVAARGLDISDVTHVYNFDLPQEVEFYVHRVGRTGRAKKQGVSYSFIKESELRHIERIEKETKLTITEKAIPTPEEVWNVRNKDVVDSIKAFVEKTDVTKTKEFATDLISMFGAETLASILIENLSKKTDIKEVSLTGEPGVIIRRGSGSGYGSRDRSSSRGGYGNRDRSASRGNYNGKKRTDGRSFDRPRSDRSKTSDRSYSRPRSPRKDSK